MGVVRDPLSGLMITLLLSFILVSSGRGTDLLFVYPKGKVNTQVVSSGVNGSFYDTKTNNFASLIFYKGRWYWWYPDRRVKQLGGLVCYSDGRVVGGYFSLSKDNKLLFNNQPFKEKGVEWAITGGGLFLVDGQIVPSREVMKREGFSSYIVYHRRFAFIVVFKDGTVKLGVSLGSNTPEEIARYYKIKGATYLLRLDGGSSTRYWRDRKPPKGIHHGFAFPSKG